MHRSIHIALIGMLLACLVATSGCSLSDFRLLLRDFESSSIDGIRLWRFEGGAWRPDLDIQFLGVVDHEDEEYLSYRFERDSYADPDSRRVQVQMYSSLDRGGNGVTLHFVFISLEEGDYKISAYNEAGESGLSRGTLSL